MDNAVAIIDALAPDTVIFPDLPFANVEEINGDVNFGSSFGDVNLPFGNDAFDISWDESTHDSNDDNHQIHDSHDRILSPSGVEAPEAAVANDA
ncbi:hypothetical protein KRX51_00820 [Corynebacterium sp. TAE3-ERU12]|uniref:hypothetical protein n=1 Tax=Corynebacterium sp. TAE3-ERU12 TaxID=2849491 RepID=UPI001C44BFF2|nr:hypothetical protein [Corynebacterium sp. TAE3-ERU12]MBV7294461.1 hypothetical protein [Corynebacterium sp. TAE3-ERU12]